MGSLPAAKGEALFVVILLNGSLKFIVARLEEMATAKGPRF